MKTFLYSENSDYYTILDVDDFLVPYNEAQIWTLFLMKKRKSKFWQKILGGKQVKIICDFPKLPTDEECIENSKLALNK
jgi:hypothetical protein